MLIYLIHTNHSSIIYCLSKNYKCHLVYVFQLKPINDWVEFFKSFIWLQVVHSDKYKHSIKAHFYYGIKPARAGTTRLCFCADKCLLMMTPARSVAQK